MDFTFKDCRVEVLVNNVAVEQYTISAFGNVKEAKKFARFAHADDLKAQAQMIADSIQKPTGEFKWVGFTESVTMDDMLDAFNGSQTLLVAWLNKCMKNEQVPKKKVERGKLESDALYEAFLKRAKEVSK